MKEQWSRFSSGRCTVLIVHWRAVGDRVKHHWYAAVECVCVCLSNDPSLTAMADLMAWSWKKTLPPSSGHTVLISSLVNPRRSLPVSTPRLLTVLWKGMKHRIFLHHAILVLFTVQTSYGSWTLCIISLTFWRNLCNPARLWPLQMWRSCPEWRDRGCPAERESEGKKLSDVKSVKRLFSRA